MATIGASVGRSGRNVRADVITVQKLINQTLHRIASIARLEPDGVSGQQTIHAIEDSSGTWSACVLLTAALTRAGPRCDG